MPYIEIMDTHKYKNKNISNAVYFHKQLNILCKLIKCDFVYKLYNQGILDKQFFRGTLIIQNSPIVNDLTYSIVGSYATENNQLHHLISGKLAK